MFKAPHFNQPMNDWDTRNITSMLNMSSGLLDWNNDTANLIKLMSILTIDMSSWEVGNVTRYVSGQCFIEFISFQSTY